MLERVTAVEYVKAVSNGRTKPAHLVCERSGGATVEVIAKFSGNCEKRETHLARELIAACLAGDLGLPMPAPYLVTVSPEFCDAVPDPTVAEKIRASSPLAFGSTLVTGQYSTWVKSNKISTTALPTALAILVFDGITQNPDRREGNSNCLTRGDEFRIFDHELCFSHEDVLFGWKAPWVLDGLNFLKTPESHIFRLGLIGQTMDFSNVRASWAGLSDARLLEYAQAVPAEWNAAASSVKAAVKLIGDARDNIDGCITEIRRVLT